jgi:hypothetical protein
MMTLRREGVNTSGFSVIVKPCRKNHAGFPGTDDPAWSTRQANLLVKGLRRTYIEEVANRSTVRELVGKPGGRVLPTT